MSTPGPYPRLPSMGLIGLTFALQLLYASPVTVTGAAGAERLSNSSEVSKSDVKAYARAHTRVNEISAFWEGSIQRSSAADVLRGVRDSEIKIAVEVEGLSLEQYRDLTALIEEDEDLQQTVEAMSR